MISTTDAHVVMTPNSKLGGYLGRLPRVMQGSSGEVEIKAATSSGQSLDLSGTATGHMWSKDSTEPARPISGPLSVSGSSILWDMDTADTAEAGQFLTIFVVNGLKSLPVEMEVIVDEGVERTIAARPLALIKYRFEIPLAPLSYPAVLSFGEFETAVDFSAGLANYLQSLYPSATDIEIGADVVVVIGTEADGSALPAEVI